MDKTLDGMIVTRIGKMWGGLEMASVQNFLETGKVSGSLYLRIKELAMQFAANWHRQASKAITGESEDGVWDELEGDIADFDAGKIKTMGELLDKLSSKYLLIKK